MDIRPIEPETLKRIQARERRDAALRAIPPIDWEEVARLGNWCTVSTASADATREDRMREFERIRKQAIRWAARHELVADVRRVDGARTVVARLLKR
jgi:hypothetical protein